MSLLEENSVTPQLPDNKSGNESRLSLVGTAHFISLPIIPGCIADYFWHSVMAQFWGQCCMWSLSVWYPRLCASLLVPGSGLVSSVMAELGIGETHPNQEFLKPHKTSEISLSGKFVDRLNLNDLNLTRVDQPLQWRLQDNGSLNLLTRKVMKPKVLPKSTFVSETLGFFGPWEGWPMRGSAGWWVMVMAVKSVRMAALASLEFVRYIVYT